MRGLGDEGTVETWWPVAAVKPTVPWLSEPLQLEASLHLLLVPLKVYHLLSPQPPRTTWVAPSSPLPFPSTSACGGREVAVLPSLPQGMTADESESEVLGANATQQKQCCFYMQGQALIHSTQKAAIATQEVSGLWTTSTRAK